MWFSGKTQTFSGGSVDLSSQEWPSEVDFRSGYKHGGGESEEKEEAMLFLFCKHEREGWPRTGKGD